MELYQNNYIIAYLKLYHYLIILLPILKFLNRQ